MKNNPIFVNDNYVKCINGVLHRNKGIGFCNYCEVKKQVLNELDKLFTEHIRIEKRKEKIQETPYRRGLIGALSFARREVRKHHLSTFSNKKKGYNSRFTPFQISITKR